jgi:hypothetical protein
VALLEQIAGAVVMVVTLLDIFLIVLYARAGTALFSSLISRAIWHGFRLISRPMGHNRGKVLSFCGPVILVGLIFVWAAGLALGAALIMHPHLGGGIRASGGSTPRDLCRRYMRRGIACPSSVPASSSRNLPRFRLSTY